MRAVPESAMERAGGERMVSPRTLAAGCLLFVAAPAWAGESLINGQPLEYNHAYSCRGERVIVAHCRDNDDSSYCQTVYPDRPFVNGMQVAPVEMRGEVIAKLNSCNQAASAPPAASAPAPSAAPRKSDYASKSKAPGLDEASWQFLGYNDEEATFFTKSGIKRTGDTAEGWFTLVYAKSWDDSSAGISGIQFFQTFFSADCSKGAFALREAAYFDEEGNLIDGAVIAKPSFKQPKKGSVGETQVNILCGKPQHLVAQKPLDGDGLLLFMIYRELLDREGKQ